MNGVGTLRLLFEWSFSNSLITTLNPLFCLFFVQTDEYIPVKEKVKMIAMQQEEIFRKEELKRQTSGQVTYNDAFNDGSFSF